MAACAAPQPDWPDPLKKRRPGGEKRCPDSAKIFSQVFWALLNAWQVSRRSGDASQTWRTLSPPPADPAVRVTGALLPLPLPPPFNRPSGFMPSTARMMRTTMIPPQPKRLPISGNRPNSRPPPPPPNPPPPRASPTSISLS